MQDLLKKIAQADKTEIEPLLKAVLKRYAELYPDWEMSTISLLKTSDRNEQLSSAIALLEQMKHMP